VGALIVDGGGDPNGAGATPYGVDAPPAWLGVAPIPKGSWLAASVGVCVGNGACAATPYGFGAGCATAACEGGRVAAMDAIPQGSLAPPTGTICCCCDGGCVVDGGSAAKAG